MLTTRIPRGHGVHRFGFDPLTGGEIEALQSVPSRAADHISQCSCNKNGGSREALAGVADLLCLALAHGHELAIQPHVTDYALDIGIGTSAFGAEEALSAKEIRTLESAPYSAADKHRGTCAACRCVAPLPIAPILTIAAIGLNHGQKASMSAR